MSKISSGLKRTAHHFFWNLVSVFGKADCRKYRIRKLPSPAEPADPFLLIANHTHYFDSFYIGYTLKTPVSYLSTDEVSTMEILGSKFFRTVFTEKGAPDIRGIRAMLNLLKEGTSVCLYPEGDRCWDGRTDQIVPKTGRLIRMFNVDIRIARVKGAYMTWPRWAKNKRYGRIDIEFENLPVSELRNMNSKELTNLIQQKIQHNDPDWADREGVQFSGKNTAEGIHYLLWKCPLCGAEDSLFGQKDTIICRCCSRSWTTNANQRVAPSFENVNTIQKWNIHQNHRLKAQIDQKTEVLCTTKNADFYTFWKQGRGIRNNGRKFRHYGKGTIRLTPSHLKFIPENSDCQPLQFEVSQVRNYVEGLHVNFTFQYEGIRYQFRTNGQNSVKYLTALKMLQEND